MLLVVSWGRAEWVPLVNGSRTSHIRLAPAGQGSRNTYTSTAGTRKWTSWELVYLLVSI